MSPQRLSVAIVIAIGIVAAPALWVALPADDAAGGSAVPPAVAPFVRPLVDRDRPAPVTAAALRPEPSAAASGATATLAVPISVAAAPTLQVGQAGELIVGVGATAASIGEIGFAVQFDPDVLQVRAGSEGDWAVAGGAAARFTADIADREDRIGIRSVASGRRNAAFGGTVAVVQFQAVAPGTTSVIVSDVVVKDADGRSLIPVVSPSTVQLTVISPPPQQRDPRQRHQPTADDAPAIATPERGD